MLACVLGVVKAWLHARVRSSHVDADDETACKLTAADWTTLSL